MNIEHEVAQLVQELRRLGTKTTDGKFGITFGVLFDDERCQQVFEALVGTLRAAKKRKVIAYEGEMLLKGAHDSVFIELLNAEEGFQSCDSTSTKVENGPLPEVRVA